ncbi:gamma-soluble NSF attachment protein [Periplaneta americana]|uniref:gamma-soluble NSF attachment protein n=1 Tax=Periplaneta americana TaxID=6978 RepID=UPI0037E94C16
MATNKKIEEGLDHIKAAEKSLKTSLLKWRPDYEIAADEYQKAATCFKNGKSFEQCKECLMKAAECHKQNRSLFHAAKCIDQAVLICKDLGDYRDVASLAERACNLYQQHGSPDSGSAALDKAAKLLESQHPEQALRLYQRAADVVLIEDSPRQGAEFISKVARIMVKLQMYDQAADAIRREIGLHQQSENMPAIGRLAVALVLVQLARGDTVAAEKAFKEWGNCCDVPEVQTLEMLLQAFDEEDPQAARSALNSPFIKHMDVEYSRLARDLPLPEGEVPVSKPSVRENAAPSYVSPKAHAAASEDAKKPAGADSSETKSHHSDDEYEGGLC